MATPSRVGSLIVCTTTSMMDLLGYSFRPEKAQQASHWGRSYLQHSGSRSPRLFSCAAKVHTNCGSCGTPAHRLHVLARTNGKRHGRLHHAQDRTLLQMRQVINCGRQWHGSKRGYRSTSAEENHDDQGHNFFLLLVKVASITSIIYAVYNTSGALRGSVASVRFLH
jgi:hypothetical protein